MLYPWELTAGEWFGPRRIAGRPSGIEPEPRFFRYARLAGRSSERDAAGFTWTIDEHGAVSCHHGGRLVGLLDAGALIVAPAMRGRGIATELFRRSWERGWPELFYLGNTLGRPINASAVGPYFAAHRLCVLAAAARGVAVAPRVLASLHKKGGSMVKGKTEKQKALRAAVARLNVERAKRPLFAPAPARVRRVVRVSAQLIERLRRAVALEVTEPKKRARAEKLLAQFEALVTIESEREREPDAGEG